MLLGLRRADRPAVRPAARAPAPVRQPVAATPLPPITNDNAVPAGANAAGAGLVAGPSVASLRHRPRARRQGADRVPAELPRADAPHRPIGPDARRRLAARLHRGAIGGDGDAQSFFARQFRDGAGRRRQGVRDWLLHPRNPGLARAPLRVRCADLRPPDRPDRRRSRQILRRAQGQVDPRASRGQEFRALLRPHRRSKAAR